MALLLLFLGVLMKLESVRPGLLNVSRLLPETREVLQRERRPNSLVRVAVLFIHHLAESLPTSWIISSLFSS